MKLAVDHSFHIGEQHLRQGKPCQDYALSGKLSETLVYAIVSDGCSSGGLTDIGARLITLATRTALQQFRSPEEVLSHPDPVTAVNSKRDELLSTYLTTLSLEWCDALATSLWLLATPNVVLGHLTGDGFMAIQYEDELRIAHGAWNHNTPYYPAYKLARKDNEFTSLHSDHAEPYTWVYEGTAPGQGGVPDGQLSRHCAEEGIKGSLLLETHAQTGWWPGNIVSIGVFSDGVDQIDGRGYVEVLTALMDFKSNRGQFATRRMNRFLTDAKKVGRGPLDDIAMAVIHFEPDTKGPANEPDLETDQG